MSQSTAVADPRKSAEDIKGFLELVVRASGAFEGAVGTLATSLTLSQWAALDILVQTDAERPYQLARKLCVSRQRAWQIARSLEKAGHVTVSEIDPHNRGVTVTATDSGLAALATFEEEIFDKVADYLNEKKPDLGLGGGCVALRSLVDAFEALSSQKAEAA